MNTLLAQWLQGILEEQKKQTVILEQIAKQQILLIQALADEQGDEDPDALPATYMDGSKVI